MKCCVVVSGFQYSNRSNGLRIELPRRHWPRLGISTPDTFSGEPIFRKFFAILKKKIRFCNKFGDFRYDFDKNWAPKISFKFFLNRAVFGEMAKLSTLMAGKLLLGGFDTITWGRTITRVMSNLAAVVTCHSRLLIYCKKTCKFASKT